MLLGGECYEFNSKVFQIGNHERTASYSVLKTAFGTAFSICLFTGTEMRSLSFEKSAEII